MKSVARTLVALALSSCGSDPAPISTPDGHIETNASAPVSLPDLDGGLGDRLVTAELDRDAAAPAIVEALAHADARVRAIGLRTLTRIAPMSAPVVVGSLFERDTPTADMLSAVALLDPPPGAPGDAVEPTGAWRVLGDELWLRVALAEDPAEARAATFALARVGGARTQALLTIAAGPDEDDTRRTAAFEAMGILCARRHALVPTALPVIADGLGASAEVRRAAAFALARCAAPSAEHFAGDERAAWAERLTAAVADDDPEVARLAWKAFEALGEAPAELSADLLGDEPPPWWVEVEAVRALAAKATRRRELVDRLVAAPTEQWTGPRAHVLLVALASLRRGVVETPELVVALAPLRDRYEAPAPIESRARKIAALARCELRGLQAIASGDIVPVDGCATVDDGLPRDWSEAFAVDVLAAMRNVAHGSVRADALVERAKDPRPAIAAPALAALADLDDARINAVLRAALARDDAGVLAAAAGAVAARAADRSKRDSSAVPALTALLGRTDPIGAIEARLAAVEALGSLARNIGEQGPAIEPADAAPPPLAAPERLAEARGWLERTVLPLATDPHAAIRRAAWSALSGEPELQSRFEAEIPTAFPNTFPQAAGAVTAMLEHPTRGIRLHTAAGVIDIALDGAPSPIAQANVAELARAGRYDGVRFHRVVPGFVAQGGDPRGDGYGGPGWLMPCEWSDTRYERGTVGIALAGKDTGGSQFFVAHTRQPHLDGRFTVIGRVVAGLDVVDALLPHDLIERAEPLDEVP